MPQPLPARVSDRHRRRRAQRVEMSAAAPPDADTVEPRPAIGIGGYVAIVELKQPFGDLDDRRDVDLVGVRLLAATHEDASPLNRAPAIRRRDEQQFIMA